MINWQLVMEQFDADVAIAEMRSTWHITIAIAAFYVISIFGIQHYKRNRTPTKLRVPLVLWSSALAVFSMMGSYHICRAFIDRLNQKGLYYVTCDLWLYYSPDTGFWLWLFIVSKIPELVDTYFIVLRKGKLIFLHWYHHLSTMIYSSYSYAYPIGTAAWFVGMNYLVHAFMYTYYAIAATGMVRIPKAIKIFITGIQTLQMFIACLINFYVIYVMGVKKYGCTNNVWNIPFSLLLYVSYFILFCHFFYESYIKIKPKPLANGSHTRYKAD